MQMHDNHSNQQNDERGIVEKFLQTAEIEIQANSIQSREPPYPDVRCMLDGGKTIAFELTETVDPDVALNQDLSVNVKGEMRNYFDDILSPSEKEKLRNIFDNGDLHFIFNDGTRKSRFRQLIPDIFHVLLRCPSDMKGDIERESLPTGVKRICIERVARFGGPWFNRPAAQCFSDTTKERINEKFNKQYECDCPIELLVHSRIRSLPPNTLWSHDVQEFVVQQLDSSPFQRVWVFDYVESEIRYVYPEKKIHLGG